MIGDSKNFSPLGGYIPAMPWRLMRINYVCADVTLTGYGCDIEVL